MSTSSSDVADEEQFFLTQTDGPDETEEQILQRKNQSQEKAAEWGGNQEPSSMKPSIKEFTKIDGNTTSYSINGIKASAGIQVEEVADLVMKKLKLKILGQPHDDVLLSTDRRFKHYKASEDRIILQKYYYTGNTTKKLVASNTTKFSSQKSLLMKYSGISTKNLVNILELPGR